MSALNFEYLLDAKTRWQPDANEWDVFISAFNDSERVQRVFAEARASKKIWWILPEYAYQQGEGPDEGLRLESHEEAKLVIDGLARSGIEPSSSLRMCFDLTGFMRPHILFLLRYLKSIGIPGFDMLYTEPAHYSRKSETRFALEDVSVVRQVAGYEGQHSPDLTNDVLIVGAGYDHELIGRVRLSKENARMVQLHSLPSLSADMYHESVLRVDRVSPGESGGQLIFASANDPFVTAQCLDEAYTEISRQGQISNLYLSPLATKVQALGFGLFYLRRIDQTAASIIFPFSTKYSRETSKGVGRTWVYPIVF